MAYLVECMLKYDSDDPSTHIVKQHIFRHGEASYDPNSSYGGRRIVEFSMKEMQEEAIGKGDLFVVPNDVVTAGEEENIRRIVRDEFRSLMNGQSSEPAKAEIHDAGPAYTNQAIGLARKEGFSEEEFSAIKGSGEDGKITKDDVEAAIKDRKGA
jgi:pyruvate/2-oxoglutarate dehydrogenase complex dihydrolipoamide acyltransferase (E2) component